MNHGDTHVVLNQPLYQHFACNLTAVNSIMYLCKIQLSSVHSHPILIIIMYFYHALINALSAHMIHIHLDMIFYTHVKPSPTKTIYIKYYLKIN